MPQVTSSEYDVAERGVYLANLCAITSKTQKQKNDAGEERDSTFWVWEFKGYKEKDKAKKIMPVEITTGTGISSKPSALKSLLSQAFEEMTFEEMKKFNTDEMINKAWRISVTVEPKQSGGGDKNVITKIEEVEIDVFADED